MKLDYTPTEYIETMKDKNKEMITIEAAENLTVNLKNDLEVVKDFKEGDLIRVDN